MAVTTVANSQFSSGQLNLSSGVWTQLNLTNATWLRGNGNTAYPCLGVMFAARSNGANAQAVFFILSNTTPVGLDIGEETLPTTANGINELRTSDPTTCWFYAQTSGDRVNLIVRY